MNYLVPIDNKKYSFAEYMAMEETSMERHDFHHGELFAMAGATANHHQVCQNINAALINKFKPQGCFVSLEGVRLEMEEEKFLPVSGCIFKPVMNRTKKIIYLKNFLLSSSKYFPNQQHCTIRR